MDDADPGDTEGSGDNDGAPSAGTSGAPSSATSPGDTDSDDSGGSEPQPLTFTFSAPRQVDLMQQQGGSSAVLLSGVNLGLVLMKEDTALVFQEAPGSLLTLDAANLRFYALTANAATAALVGVPEVTATATGIQIRVNEGEAGSAWLGNLAAATPIVDFQQSFGVSGYICQCTL